MGAVNLGISQGCDGNTAKGGGEGRNIRGGSVSDIELYGLELEVCYPKDHTKSEVLDSTFRCPELTFAAQFLCSKRYSPDLFSDQWTNSAEVPRGSTK